MRSRYNNMQSLLVGWWCRRLCRGGRLVYATSLCCTITVFKYFVGIAGTDTGKIAGIHSDMPRRYRSSKIYREASESMK
jgi:hypothetical protein